MTLFWSKLAEILYNILPVKPYNMFTFSLMVSITIRKWRIRIRYQCIIVHTETLVNNTTHD